MAAQIRAQLALRGWSQAELAKRMGYQQIWISRRLSPNVGPRTISINLDELEEFSTALGVPITSLLPRLDSNQQPFGSRDSNDAHTAEIPNRTAAPRRGHLFLIRNEAVA